MIQRMTQLYHHQYRNIFIKLTDYIAGLFAAKNTLEMSDEYRNYISYEYPQNHTYTIVNNQFKPKYKLFKRYKKLRKLYPDKFTSFLDVGCSKGFFVFSANESKYCLRSLGIDVNQYALNVCRWIQQKLKIHANVRFEKLRIHELSERINEFGGPFQVVLVVNLYQYLYFGSDFYRDNYMDHDNIFNHLHKICSERIIFNNRVNLEDCQNVNCIDYNDIRSQNYTEEKMLEAAAKYFVIKKHGNIGKCPLYTMEKKYNIL